MHRAAASRVVLLALVGGVLVDIAGPGNAVGINAPLVITALLAAASVVAGRDGLRRMDPADAWMAPAAVVLAAMAAIRADPWLVGADLWLSLLLVFGAIGTLAGGRITRGLVPRVLELGVGLLAVTAGGAIAVLRSIAARPAAVPVGPAEAVAEGRLGQLRGTRRLGRLVPLVRGLLVALPIVAIFSMLFASADAVFARFAGDLFAWRWDLDIADAIERSVVVGSVAWAWAGLFAFAGGYLPALVGAGSALLPVSEPGAGGARALRLGGIEATTVLIVLDALFALFVVLQVAYLFGGRDTLATAGLTYADYARRGFFELVAVAALVVAVVTAMDLAVGRRSRAQLVASLLLLALTAVVLVSAVVRLRLYQEAYGWTELRFLVAVAIAWLAAALAIAAGLLLTRRAAWTLHALGILLLVAVGATNVVGPQAFVAERNLERAIDPSLVAAGGRTGLDADYLSRLGDEAVPAAVAAVDRLPDPADRDRVSRFLAGRAADLRERPELLGWPAWNLSRERAREVLAAWEARQTAELVRAGGLPTR